MKENKTFQYFDFFLLATVYLSLTIIPFIKIREGFYIGFEDIVLPLIFFRILQKNMYYFDKYILFLLFFILYIFFTIAINKRLWSLRDYFEIYKIGKFILIVLFAKHVFPKNYINFNHLVNFVFIVLLILNLAHYFDVFHFNEIVEPYYATNNIHLSTFGLDSLGNPDVRRMIGTFGNPNDNATLFLFFFIYYLSKTNSFEFKKEQFFIYLSFLCILLTQSRTGFIAGMAAYTTWSVLTKQKLKNTIINISFFIISFFIAFSFSPLSLNYYSNTSANLAENSSVLGRLDMWKLLLKMIEQKPIFGYGPNKDYFYDNHLYPESEYVLFTWRYGIVGFFIYLGWLLLPLFKGIFNGKMNTFYILLAIIIGVNALTNCPLSNPKIFLLFAIFTGYHFAKVEEAIKTKNV